MVCVHSAGTLYSASTVPPSPCQPPGPAGKCKDKLFPCYLATAGKPSSGSEPENEAKKHRLRKDFFVVIYLIKLKDYTDLSQSFPFNAASFPPFVVNCYFANQYLPAFWCIGGGSRRRQGPGGSKHKHLRFPLLPHQPRSVLGNNIQ